MKNRRNVFFSLILAMCIFMPAFSLPSENLLEYHLENGLTVFFLPDYSVPSVRTELAVRAGFSDQEINNAGFFSLYSRIVQANLKCSFNLEAECNSDSTHYVFYSTPSSLENKFYELSESVFSPVFTDETSAECIAEMKRQVLESSNDTATLINAAIDSRVFSECPWKHDSGIYPALFNGMNMNQIRTLLYHIAEDYYIPENCALFINGAVPTEKLQEILERTFGSYTSNNHKKNRAVLDGNFSVLYDDDTSADTSPRESDSRKIRKFVLHDRELSPDMTQIVIQYKFSNALNELNFSEYTAVLAAAMNSFQSEYKTALLAEKSLEIPGAEYIDVSSANKRNVSRFIIQSLLQKNTEISPCAQSELFLSKTERLISEIPQSELENAVQILENEIIQTSHSATSYMERISNLWASGFDGSSINQSDNLMEYADSKRIAAFFEEKVPFVFVLINSADYKKYKNEFEEQGYEVIDSKNASWYSQSLYDAVRTEAERTLNQRKEIKRQHEMSAETFFINENSGTVKHGKLSNEIDYFVKTMPNTEYAAFLMNIKGGKLASYNDNGFEELMIDIVAGIVKEKIAVLQNQGKLKGSVSVFSDTELTYSTVGIVCLSEDLNSCIQAAGEAIITGAISPAMADRLVSSAQYKKRLENGTASYQLYCAMVKALFGKSPVSGVYACDDILKDVDFDKILNAWQNFLNASRFSFVLCGALKDYDDDLNFDDVHELLEKSFSLLIKRPYESVDVKKPSFPKSKNLSVKIVHTFLTDIPASKTGKMPAVLVPTTEFLDPVIYTFKLSEKNPAAEILGFYLRQKITAEFSKRRVFSSCTAVFTSSNEVFPFVSFTLNNVKSIVQLKQLYSKIMEELKNQLSSSSDAAKTAEIIKNTWLFDFYGQSDSPETVAALIQKGLVEENNPELYLEKIQDCEKLTPKDFMDALENVFENADLVIYSKDAEK